MGNLNTDGTFGLFPQHGYWGSKLVRTVTKEANLPEDVLKYLETFVDFHVVAADIWLSPEAGEKDSMVWRTKLMTRGMQLDLLFSMYCDFFYHPDFQQHKQAMIDAFNDPKTYEPLNSQIMK